MKKRSQVLRSKLFIFFILMLFCRVAFAENKQVPIEEQPMYGSIPPTPELQKANDEFIKEIVKANGSKEAALQLTLDIAWDYLKKGDLKLAMKRLNQAWLLDPNNARVHFGFGLVLVEQHNDQEAIKSYTKAIEIDSKLSIAYYNRAGSYNTLGLYSDAVDDFTKVIELDPADGQAYYNRAGNYFLLKKYDESWKDVHKAESLEYKPDPKFLMLVVIDRPTSSIYGSETAAPTFFRVAKNILTYYGIPPSE